MNQELRLIELRDCILLSPVSLLFCDIKMFCAPFACVRRRQNRLNLSQRDTAEKSECKTLISPDRDEGSLPVQHETLRSQDSYWLTNLEQKHSVSVSDIGRGSVLDDQSVL